MRLSGLLLFGSVVDKNTGAPSGTNFGSMATLRSPRIGTPSAPNGPGKPAGMGARFVALEGESRARIFHIVDHYVTATGAPAFDVEAGP